MNKLLSKFSPSRWLLMILAAAFVLRVAGILWGISFAPPVAQQMHPDEPKIFYAAMLFPEDVYSRTDLRYPTGLHYLAGLLSLPAKSAYQLDLLSGVAYTQIVFLLARSLSILSGVGAVYLSYSIARRLDGERAGLLAASFLTVSLYHVRHSALATTDVVNSFFMALVVWLLLSRPSWGAGRDQRPHWGNLAALGAALGLAIGTKYSAAVMAAPVVLVYARQAWSARSRLGQYALQLFAVALVMLLVFTLSTPGALLRPASLLESLLYESGRVDAGRAGLQIDKLLDMFTSQLNDVLGWPLTLLVVIGALGLLWPQNVRKYWPVWLPVLAYLLFFGSSMLLRYYISILPLLAVLAAYLPARGLARGSTIRPLVAMLLAVALLSSLSYTLRGLRIVLADTRTAAAYYFYEHVPPGATVGGPLFGNLPRSQWTLPHVDDTRYSVISNLEAPEYIILSSIHYDRIQALLATQGVRPEYVVSDDLAREHKLIPTPSPEVLRLHDQLLNGAEGSQYTLLEWFKPVDNVPIEFPPPVIRIYQRDAEQP
ncbi:MAG: phospholipid carrier-dependent glycosyltransferase [Anaerolineales bacterium]|nr:MAG: phospholipid carrier-dependent glycosyltransferase [Anaerolineales bacterium]